MARERRTNIFDHDGSFDVRSMAEMTPYMPKWEEAENDHYTYTVTWSAPDGEFLATVAEFPSLSWLASSRRMALIRLVALVSDTLAEMRERGETPPSALADRM